MKDQKKNNLIWTNIADILYNNEVILQIIYPPDYIYLYLIDDGKVSFNKLLAKIEKYPITRNRIKRGLTDSSIKNAYIKFKNNEKGQHALFELVDYLWRRVYKFPLDAMTQENIESVFGKDIIDEDRSRLKSQTTTQ